MRVYGWMVLVPLVAVAACGRNSSPSVDDALKSDLALASQAQGANAPISPNEAGYAPQSAQSLTAARPVHRAPARSTSHRSSSVYRSSGSSGGYYPAPTPKTTIVKHTERDAAIGAAAGAVLGATSSRNKIRGGVIGAMVGGVLGGVLGNNVDIQKKTGW